MERKPIVQHDNGSVTIEGDGREYLTHLSDHQKGRGECEEHTSQWGHEEMHNIPHNENPISEYVGKAKDAVKGVVSDVGTMVRSAADTLMGGSSTNPNSLRRVRDRQEGAYQGVTNKRTD